MADILLGNVKGPQGNTGATGSQGPQGDAATITVGTVSTTAYGNTASVTNSGTEQDAVLDFVIPQGKPGEQTTRMGALTLDTITAQSADFPIPAVGETGSTVFGKIIKFFNSTISALNSKLNISDVVNNLTSTSTTQPLSAAQGKALNDAITNNVVGFRSANWNFGFNNNANIRMDYENVARVFLISWSTSLLFVATQYGAPTSWQTATVTPIVGTNPFTIQYIDESNKLRLRISATTGMSLLTIIPMFTARNLSNIVTS